MAFKDMFSFLFQRSTQEERVAQYVIREHDRGRSLHDILEDKYVVNRLESPGAARPPARPARDPPRGRRRHGRGRKVLARHVEGRKARPSGRYTGPARP